MTTATTTVPTATKIALKKMTPDLAVKDVRRTIEFYRDVLGFEVRGMVPDSPDAERYDWAMVSREGVTLMFEPRGVEGPGAASVAPSGDALILYTEVEGVEALRAELDGKVEIVEDLHDTFYGTREFCFRDCNGYQISFSEDRSRGADESQED